MNRPDPNCQYCLGTGWCPSIEVPHMEECGCYDPVEEDNHKDIRPESTTGPKE